MSDMSCLAERDAGCDGLWAHVPTRVPRQVTPLRPLGPVHAARARHAGALESRARLGYIIGLIDRQAS